MIDFLLHMPLFHKVNSVLLLASAALCLLLWAGAVCVRAASHKLPRVSRFPGSGFPNLADEGFTLLFVAFFTTSCLSSLGSEGGSVSTKQVWLLNIYQALLYLPFALRYMSLPPAQGAFFSRHLLTVLKALVLIYACCIALSVIGFDKWLVNLTDTPVTQEITDMMKEDFRLSTRIALCFGTIIIAPVMEEFAFRGFLYNILRQRIGIFSAALASSFFFAAIHMSLVQTLPLFFFALAQCYVYEKTGSLRFCIALHVLFNTISSIAILFAF